LTRNGRVRYELKTPWRNGTTHVVFEPLDFISKLVSLVPKPRVNLTRFHGVFEPNSQYCARVTPASRGKHKKRHSADETDQTPAEKRASMTWVMPLHYKTSNLLERSVTDTCVSPNFLQKKFQPGVPSVSRKKRKSFAGITMTISSGLFLAQGGCPGG